MGQLSTSATERSRKAFTAFLDAMKPDGTARNVAQAMGVSEATVSRIKNEKVEDAIALLYQLGFKVVDESRVCVDRSAYEALSTLARKAMSCDQTARRLIWDES
jgi:hypothetical protein